MRRRRVIVFVGRFDGFLSFLSKATRDRLREECSRRSGGVCAFSLALGKGRGRLRGGTSSVPSNTLAAARALFLVATTVRTRMFVSAVIHISEAGQNPFTQPRSTLALE
jgi:hypothetical protein